LEKFDPIQYKLKSRNNWNTVASRYHVNWAVKDIGPFGSTEEIVKIADIRSNDIVLDVACGTGAVSKKIVKRLGHDGKLIGVDLSRGALNIAKIEVKKPNVNFIEMDLEKIAFSTNFSKVLCQYALMYLTSPTESNKSINELM
jgi:ubiquinone/menaquinone biosynthesis C-methylase UbiE